MEYISKDVISILQYLLPGFLCAWVFYAFTSYPKPSPFERVIQALIFTIIIQVGVLMEKYLLMQTGKIFAIGLWDEQAELFNSVIGGFVLGVTFSCFANNDKFHKLFRYMRITRETSYPSEWAGVFINNATYVVLHLKDERRLYGWPREWPTEPNRGHFVVERPSWLDENGEKPVEIPITGVSSIIIDVNDVRWVEFMEKIWESKNG